MVERLRSRRGSILLAHFPTKSPIGHEQMGTRPCILIIDPSKIHPIRFPLIIVAPLTTKSLDPLQLYPRLSAGVGGLPRASTVLLDQIAAIDARRIYGIVGTLDTDEFAPIQKGLSLMFH